jgi:hypothetical protein
MMPHAHNDSDQLQEKRMTAVNQFSRCLHEEKGNCEMMLHHDLIGIAFYLLPRFTNR